MWVNLRAKPAGYFSSLPFVQSLPQPPMTPESEPWPGTVRPPARRAVVLSKFLNTRPLLRVPEGVRAGVFCTGTTILQTSEEFVIDFLSTMVPPQQVAARVVMTPNTFGQMIGALQANLGKYQQQFGRLIAASRPPHRPRGTCALQEMVTRAGLRERPAAPSEVPIDCHRRRCRAGRSGRRWRPARPRPPSRGSRTSTTN